MKKFLLFLMAFLLFAPSRANAEDKTAVLYSSQDAELKKIVTYSNYPYMKVKLADVSGEYSDLSLSLARNNIAQLEYDNGIKIYCDVVEQNASQNVGFSYVATNNYFTWPTNDTYKHTLRFRTEEGSKIKSVKISLINGVEYYPNIYDDRSKVYSIKSDEANKVTYDSGAGTALIENTGSKDEIEIYTEPTTSTSIKIIKIEVNYESDTPAPVRDITADVFNCEWRNTYNPKPLYYRIAEGEPFTQFNPQYSASVIVETIKYSGIPGADFTISTPDEPGINTLTLKGAPQGTGVNNTSRYGGDNQRYIYLCQNHRIRFNFDYHVIKDIKIYTYEQVQPDYVTGYDTEGNKKTLTDSELNSNLTVSTLKVGNNTSTYLTTIKPFEGQSYIDISYSKSDLKIYRVLVTYEDGDITPPGKPRLNVFPGFGYKFDQDTNTLSIPTFPSSKAAKQVAANFSLNGGAADRLYYTFSETAPTPTEPVTANDPADAATGWIIRDAGLNTAGILFAPMIPSDETLDSRTFKIRAIAYSSITKQFSEETVIHCETYRLSAPSLDLDKIIAENKTAKEFEFDPETNTLYYVGYNPTIFLKEQEDIAASNYTNTGYYTHYNTSFTNITPTSTSGSVIFNPAINEKDGIIIRNGTQNLQPVHGQVEVLNLLSYVKVLEEGSATQYLYDTNGGEMTVFRIVCNNEAEIPTITSIAAPSVTPTKPTVALSGGVFGYIDDRISVDFHTHHSWANGENPGTLQYQWVEPSDGVWALEPTGKWTDVTDGKFDIPAKTTGRLFVREFKNSSDYESRIAFYDFRFIPTVPINNVAYNTLIGVNDNATVVTITKPLRVIGFFRLSDESSNVTVPVYLMFAADEAGNVLRVHIESNNIDKYSTAYSNYYLIDGLTGELHKNKEMPELYLNNGTLDYSPLIGEPYKAPADFAKYEPEFIQRVPAIADYSKLLYIGPLRWNASTQTLTDNNGGTVKLYPRIVTKPSATDIEAELIDGVQYRIAGYVGYADGAPVILPRAYVAAPLLRAPNPVNTEAEPGKLINMNVISDELELTVSSNGVAEGTILQYFIFEDTGNNEDTKPVTETDSRWNNNTVVKTITDLKQPVKVKTDKSLILAARFMSGTMPSGVVTVRLNKITVPDSSKFTTIADFKKAVANTNLPELNAPIAESTHSFCQYIGKARVIEVNQDYIYIRATEDNGGLLDSADENNLTDEQKQNRSDNSILIYNANGWKYDVISVDSDGNTDTRTPLKKGDIITNFALIPTRSAFGNLVANATDFIRTFRKVYGLASGSTAAIEINAQDNEVPTFTDNDLMLRYCIRNVAVSRTAKTRSASSAYTYTLNIPGNPILNNGDVFGVNPDFDIIWSESTLFDLEGVVMMNDNTKPEGTEGRYMFAVMPDKISVSGVEAPEAPVITIEGIGAEATDDSFVTEAKVIIKSSAESNTVIYYTTDNTDPRLSPTRQQYNAPFTINANTIVKAYVLSNGTPNSKLAETMFIRTAVDTRYIVNFINQAEKNTPFHLTAYTKVVATGGDYFFLRGTQGHYLPVKDETGNRSIVTKLKKGDYLNDMVITPHMVGNVVRGAHVEAAHKNLFKGTVKQPADLNIEAEPDIVNTITADNARRYVKIMNVKLVGEQFNSEGNEPSTYDTSWKLTTDKGHGKDIRVNHNILEPSFDWDETDQSAAAYYNITGFAMIGDDGEIELWPTEVEKIKTSVTVIAAFTNTIHNSALAADGRYDVTFSPNTIVTLSAIKGATIYYQISDSENAETEDDKWNMYGQPFAVTRSCYIHAYSIAPGYEESGHTHIALTLDYNDLDYTVMSGEVNINHTINDDGVPVIWIEPKAQLTAGSYKIYYTIDGSTPTVDTKNLYTGEFQMPDGGVIYAILKETDKELPGNVACLVVWNTPSAIDGIDSDFSGSNGVRTESGNIIAPEGSMVFDLNGRRVSPSGLSRGIYIVCVPGIQKAVKIKVD